MTLLLPLLAAALAGPAEDLESAADKALPEAERMAAFQRLLLQGATDISFVGRVAADPAADARQRWVALRVLGRAGGPQARDALLRTLQDDMPAMRAAACSALGDVGDRSTTAAVAAHLADPAVIVRAAAAEALGRLRDPASVPALTEALDDPGNYFRGTSLWVRRHYVEALGSVGHESAFPALLAALDDADAEVARAAVGAFEAIAGFSFAEGRTEQEEREAWRRWSAARIRGGG